MAITKVSRNLLNTGVSDSSDATAITITSAEKVGIGTSDPSQLLNVQSATFPVVEVANYSDSNPTDGAALDLIEKQPSYASATNTFGQTGVYGFRLKLNGADNTLRLKSGSQTTVNDRIVIDRDVGNVGIGGTTLTGWANRQVVLDGGSLTSVAYVMVNDTTGRSGTDGSVITLSGSDMYLIQRESANMIFRTANTERMRIDSTGDVFIGTTSHFSGGSNAGDAVAVVNGGVNREGVPFTDFDEAYVSENRGIFEGTSGFQPSNNPGGSNWWHVISRTVNTGGSSIYITQTATSITGAIHTRYSTNTGSTWTSWQSV